MASGSMGCPFFAGEIKGRLDAPMTWSSNFSELCQLNIRPSLRAIRDRLLASSMSLSMKLQDLSPTIDQVTRAKTARPGGSSHTLGRCRTSACISIAVVSPTGSQRLIKDIRIRADDSADIGGQFTVSTRQVMELARHVLGGPGRRKSSHRDGRDGAPVEFDDPFDETGQELAPLLA